MSEQMRWWRDGLISNAEYFRLVRAAVAAQVAEELGLRR